MCRGWLVLALASLVACSVIVEGQPERLRCSDEGRIGPPACDEGQICQDGLCRAFEAANGGAPAAEPSRPGPSAAEQAAGQAGDTADSWRSRY
jgi:hypothetical protein